MDVPVHPIQVPAHSRGRGTCPQTVTMKAYEVYSHVYSPQAAIVTGDCRGGFSVGELIAFLYAASFPRNEWQKRTDEAFAGLSMGDR